MAHFKVDIDVLNNVLGYATAVTNDSSLKDSDKTVIFMVKEGESVAIAKNADLFSRMVFAVEGIEEEGNIQVSSSELSKILSTFQGLSRTKVDFVEFIESNAKIRVLVHESDLEEVEEGQEPFGGITSYALDNIKIRSKLLEDISVDFPEESSTIESINLELILSSLMPNMESKKGTNNNTIHFAEDYVFVIDTRCQTFFDNSLPEVMQSSTLRYSSVNYLKKLIDSSTSLFAAIVGNKIAFKTLNGEIEAFVTNIPVRYAYKTQIESISKENGAIIDRKFLKDIIRRLSIMNSNPVFEFTPDGLKISTEGFSRVVPLIAVKGNIEGITFKASTSLMNTMIVGEDSLMSENLYMYLSKSPRGVGYQLTISDDTGVFLSSAIVN